MVSLLKMAGAKKNQISLEPSLSCKSDYAVTSDEYTRLMYENLNSFGEKRSGDETEVVQCPFKLNGKNLIIHPWKYMIHLYIIDE